MNMHSFKPCAMGRALMAAGIISGMWLTQACPAQAQQRNSGRVSLVVPGHSQPQSLYEGSYALLIGASAYRNGWNPLPGVKRDIGPVKDALEKHGFNVQVVNDPTRDQLDAALRNFVAEHGHKEHNRLLVYFAGHGESLDARAGGKQGYIVPVDAPLAQKDPVGFRRLAYSMDQIEVHAKQIQSKHALFVFDSCFSGTIFRASSAQPDHISEKTSRAVRQFISSGDAGQTVPDVSIFRQRFVRALVDNDADVNKDGYITGSELGSYLEDSVTNESRKAQTPRHGKIWDGNLNQGDFVFASLRVEPTAVPPAPPRPAVVQADPEQETWDLAKRRDTVAAYRAYLEAYPQGRYATPARAALAGLQPTPNPAPQPAVAPTASAAPAPARQPFEPEMVIIPAGSFTMGSNDGDANEKPTRQVSIRRFELGKYEVTQGQWKAVMGNNPSRFSNCGDNCPVERVHWHEIQEYIQKLNQKSGRQYRLPSEAEWEYAARAGTTSKYWWGDTASHEYANYGKDDCCEGLAQGRDQWVNTAPIGQFPANAYGLHDMHGNVSEWVQDVVHDNYNGAPMDGSAWTTGGSQSLRVLRGGSWGDVPDGLRSANRSWYPHFDRFYSNGFRLARTVP